METLFWLTGLLFAALLPWGTNVPAQKPAKLIKAFVIFNIAVHLITQGFVYNTRPAASDLEGGSRAEQRYKKYIDVLALTPSKVESEGGWRWGQLVTANFIHEGWLHLAMNLWIFALYGQNLEDRFGPRKFGFFMAAALLGSQSAVLIFAQHSLAFHKAHAGFSGVVYAVIAAYLICFPRSKIKVALIYDLRFWAIILFVLIPVIYLFGFNNPNLAELLLLVGTVGIFIVMQPEHARFGVTAFLLLGYKLLQDFLSVDKQVDELTISVWSHGGGFIVGMVAGLWVNGARGLHMVWEDMDEPRRKKTPTKKESLARLEKRAQTDREASRQFLGQRVFVGDSARAVPHYTDVVMKRFPDIVLDQREQLALARMLEFKNLKPEALHAYQGLLQTKHLSPGYESAYLQVAKLHVELKTGNDEEALSCLTQYEGALHLMRDKLEVRELRTRILANAQRDSEVVKAEPVEQTLSRDISPDDEPQSDPLSAATAPVIDSVVLQGRKPLPLKFTAESAMRLRLQRQEEALPTPGRDVPPPLPEIVERSAGLRRASRVDLSGLPLRPRDPGPETPEPVDPTTASKQSLKRLLEKGEAVSYGSLGPGSTLSPDPMASLAPPETPLLPRLMTKSFAESEAMDHLLEAVTIEVNHEGISFRALQERLQVSYSAITLLDVSRVRLSSRPTSPRYLIFAIDLTSGRRVVAHQRTLNAKACKVNNESVAGDEPLLEIYRTIYSYKFHNAAPEPAMFDTYTQYDDYLTQLRSRIDRKS